MRPCIAYAAAGFLEAAVWVDRVVTDNARKFIAANERSPVVSGSAIGSGGEGAIYTLKNGKTFTLSADDCKAVGYPRWDFPA